MTTDTSALATEKIYATHWLRFGVAVAAALIPAAALAPTFASVVLPGLVSEAMRAGDAGFWLAFKMLAGTFAALTALVLFLWM